MPASLIPPPLPVCSRVPLNRATSQMRVLAGRIIALERSGPNSAATRIRSAMPAPERLRPPLASLMGIDGFRALLSRALALAGAEVPWLRAVRVESDGTLDGWMQPYALLGPEQYHEGRVVLLAQLLGLLVAFIGERLTLRLLLEEWPKLSGGDLDF